MPCRDGEGLVVACDTLELTASFYGFLGGSIDATGGLAKVEGGFSHNTSLGVMF